MRRDVARFPSPYRVPVGALDQTVVAAGGDGHSAVVLLRAVDVVGRPGYRRSRGKTARSAGCPGGTTLPPPVIKTVTPPSLEAIIRFVFRGSIHKP